MSVYKPKGSPYYHYDFQLRGRRFCGSTERTSKRAAEQVEEAKREGAKAEVRQAQGLAASAGLVHIAARYWGEAGCHSANAKTTERDLARLVEFFGATRLLTEIRDSDVAKLVAWRRGHHVVRSKKADPKKCPLISNATVNRSTTELLRRLFSRARKHWGVKFDNEPRWAEHMLPEAQERVRELQGTEGAKLEAATRADYRPFFAFAALTGLRLRECLLKWSEVNWDAGQIQKIGKGGKRVTTPITSAVRRTLWPLRGHHEVYVFTYVPKRQKCLQEHIKGVKVLSRAPITYSGVKTQWRRLRKRAGVVGFRFHDYRHDLGSKIVRKTGNLKLAQKALNHSSLSSTTRYVHVLDSELVDVLEDMAPLERRETKRRRA